MADKKEKSKLFTFIADGLSIDETKVSFLIIALGLLLIFGCVMYVLVGDITANLASIVIALIYGITGVNVTDKITNLIGNLKNSVTPSSVTPPANNNATSTNNDNSGNADPSDISNYMFNPENTDNNNDAQG